MVKSIFMNCTRYQGPDKGPASLDTLFILVSSLSVPLTIDLNYFSGAPSALSPSFFPSGTLPLGCQAPWLRPLVFAPFAPACPLVQGSF